MKTLLIAMLLVPLVASAEWKYNLNFEGDYTGGGTITFHSLTGYCTDTGCPEANWVLSPTIDLMITSVITGKTYDNFSFTTIGFGDAEGEIAWDIDTKTNKLQKLVLRNGISGGTDNWEAALNGEFYTSNGRPYSFDYTGEEAADQGNYDTYVNGQSGFVTLEYVPEPKPLTINFGQPGIWQLASDNSWRMIHASGANNMASGDFDGDGEQDLVISFGQPGTWIKWGSGKWQRIHPLPVDQIVVSDMDGNGEDDIVASFEKYGIYKWTYLKGGWIKIHSLPAKGATF